MNAQRLYRTLRFLDDLDRNLGLQAKLEEVRDHLRNLVNAPAQPQYQTALAGALSEFSKAASRLDELITPSLKVLIAGIGGEKFFDASISESVRNVIATNAMTPSVAGDFVANLAKERAGFLATVKSTLDGLSKMGIEDEPIPPGSAEMAFLIPRALFENHLGEFAKELTFINHLVRNFSEAVTGQAEPVELQRLSSSIPTITIAAAAHVMLAIGTVVSKFLEAWKKIEEIREIRSRLTKMGMKGAAVDQLTEQITTIVDEVVEESTEVLLVKYKSDEGRKNELQNALKKDTRRLFAQIERGLTIEVRADRPDDKGSDSANKALEDIADLGRELQFPRIVGEPVLLPSGDILEDVSNAEGLAVLKKTTTHKTTTHKTTTKKEVDKPTLES